MQVCFKGVIWSHPSPIRDLWQVLGYMDKNTRVICRVSGRDLTTSNLITLLGSQQNSLKRTKNIWNLFTTVRKTTLNEFTTPKYLYLFTILYGVTFQKQVRFILTGGEVISCIRKINLLVAVLLYGSLIKIRHNDKETICLPYKPRSEAFTASHPKSLSSPIQVESYWTV
jgi:hypothetical protein